MPTLFIVFRVDDEHAGTVVFVSVDTAFRRIVGDRIDVTFDVGASDNRLFFRIHFGYGVRFTVTRENVAGRGIDRNAVQRADFHLADDAAAIRIDDKQSLARRVRGVNAPARRVDRNVVEAAEDRYALWRQNG